MGGLAAVIFPDGAPADEQTLALLTGQMRHRAPDGIFHRLVGSAALGQCRQCVTVESLDEVQPLANEDSSLALVLDGYLSNWETLRAELLARGHRLRDRSDAELALRAFEQWGEEAPVHLEGQFAIVVWDSLRNRLVACNDHQALRPLHYCQDRDRLIIATDVAAIMAALSTPPELNSGYLAELLADDFYTFSETIWQGISRLPPAHVLVAERGQLSLREYWRPDTRANFRYARPDQYVEHYREVLYEAVRGSCRSHRPLAFEVSGGLDSSALFCVAHDLAAQGRMPAPGIRGYTLAGVEGTASWELDYVEAVEKHTGRPIQREAMTLHSLAQLSDTALRDRDLPIRPNLAMAEGMHRRMAEDGCQVAVNGIGGDQWLDGTAAYYYEMLARGEWEKLARAYTTDCRLFGVRVATRMLVRYGIWQFAPDGLRQARRALAERRGGGWLGRHGWLSQATRDELARRRAQYLARFPSEKRDSYKLQTLFNAYLPVELAHFDRHLSRLGMQPRSPMLSRSFIEFCASLPEELRVRAGVTRWIHREALRGILPDSIRDRRDKADFTVAIDHQYADLGRFLGGPIPPELGQTVDSGSIDVLRQDFLGAPIYERPYWRVWSTYEYALTLIIRDQGRNCAASFV